jgi:NAD(P)-dependent dehydrogenase (short-subunit alcohol dehydrogenase family)
VTGVSTGIGAAIVRELVAAGFQVFGTVRRAKDMGPVQAAGAVPIIVDVAHRASVVRAQDTVARALGERPLAGLVNNAGIPGVGPVELLDLEELRRIFEVNVLGAVAAIQSFLPMLRASRGRVVNISSVSARLALPFAGSYAASKFALEAISDSLRRELVGTGVEVVVIQPGSVQTAIWSKIAAVDLTATTGTIYAPALRKLREITLREAEKGLPPESVAQAVLRALTDVRPPTRILVVSKGALKRRLLQFIPDRWVDRMIAKRLKP